MKKHVGRSFGHEVTQETREKISKALKGRSYIDMGRRPSWSAPPKTGNERAKKYRDSWTPERRKAQSDQTKAWRAANPEKLREYKEKNKEAIRAAQNKWKQEHPEKDKEYTKRCRIKRQYGLTPEAVDSLLEQQENKCLICGDFVEFGRAGSAHIDHDHKTSKIRGILCSCCNTGIGHFKEDPNRMLAAIAYLEKHNQV